MELLTNKEKQAVGKYLNTLQNRLPDKIEAIILFGSKARGETTKTSDLDLAVVVNKDSKSIHREIIGESIEPAAKYNLPLSPIVLGIQEFDHWSPFIENLRRDGQILWRKTNKNILKRA